MKPVDQKIFDFIELLRKKGEIRFDQEVWDAIGARKESTSNIRNGRQSFQIYHIQNLCKVFGANANWILGLEKNAFRFEKKVTVSRQANRQ